ncbi:positive regulator of sigma E activity [Pedobacter cryoconitis]|uniref:Positive regulator of sigma E activity n=1 Tax=Pedobacter cryoconitis TaxID=188932 RepID=A0A7X0J2M5_9SPHI|nr:positive regulator of sigma E activity [Pedobacter cryoconitis]
MTICTVLGNKEVTIIVLVLSFIIAAFAVYFSFFRKRDTSDAGQH